MPFDCRQRRMKLQGVDMFKSPEMRSFPRPAARRFHRQRSEGTEVRSLSYDLTGSVDDCKRTSVPFVLISDPSFRTKFASFPAASLRFCCDRGESQLSCYCTSRGDTVNVSNKRPEQVQTPKLQSSSFCNPPILWGPVCDAPWPNNDAYSREVSPSWLPSR